MSYTVTYVSSAAKALRKLDRPTAQRLIRAIEGLAEDPRPPGCIQLAGGDGELRIRVGDYRIIYDVVDEELFILVLKVGHRRQIYK